MFGFKSFWLAKNVLAGIELMRMIGKGRRMIVGGNEMSFADQFYALAGKIRSVRKRVHAPAKNLTCLR